MILRNSTYAYMHVCSIFMNLNYKFVFIIDHDNIVATRVSMHIPDTAGITILIYFWNQS